jgi:agmatinase
MNNTGNSKHNKINNFNPDGVGITSANIFGLPFTLEESDVVIIPVPWDVTVSSEEGTAQGPMNVFNESFQIDLFDEVVSDPWKAGIAMEEIPGKLIKQNKKLRKKARAYIQYLEKNGPGKIPKEYLAIRDEINQACQALCDNLQAKCSQYLSQDKLPVILGGDHSTPLGLIKALAGKNESFGILQIDAHADLRPAYEGFTHSHASIMYNALAIDQVSKLVQVGTRDFCNQEWHLIQENPERIKAFTSRELHKIIFEGKSWLTIADEVINELPDKVYISFDVDGLDPALCPGTGTPVPGGLSFNQALFLAERLVETGRTIIGSDLVETGPQQLDGIVSCRLLYRLIALMLRSNKRL